MNIRVQFFSYFKDLAQAEGCELMLPYDATIQTALDEIYARFPKLEPARNSTLIAVGVDYVRKADPLHDGDLISLFPPVQGG